MTVLDWSSHGPVVSQYVTFATYNILYTSVMYVDSLDNSELQKQVIFDLRTARKIWAGIERLLDMGV